MPNYYDPNITTESKQRRAYAKRLMEQSQQPQGTEYVGNVAVAQSPIAALARAIQGGIGQYQDTKADSLDQQAMMQKQQALSDALAKMGSDPQAAAGILAQNPETADAGFKLYGDAINRQAEAAMEDQKYQREMMRDDRRFDNQRELQQMRMGSTQPYVDPDTGEVVMPQPKLSPTAQKELYDTIDTVNQGQGALSDITRAKALATNKNNPIYSGFGSDMMVAANRLPVIGAFIDDKKATNTTEYNNLVKGQALSSLKSIFGGNPTEGERAILLQMQALSDKTPQEQAAILANAERAIERRNQFNQSKAKNIQSGDYRAMVDFGQPQGTINPQEPASNAMPQGEVIGTSGGKRVFRLPDGTHVMEQ